MPQTLDQLLSERWHLVTSDDAALDRLRQIDRRVLTRVEQGDAGSPLPREMSSDSLLPLTAMPVVEATLWLEVAVSISGVKARPALDTLAKDAVGHRLSWWLAANYPALAMTLSSPQEPELQMLAARASWRRGEGETLPRPWREWAGVLDGRVELSKPLVEQLWSILPARDEPAELASWKEWFYPLLVSAPEEWQLWLVNWLLAEADTTTTVEAMGVSCARRFLSWLEAIGAGTGLDGNLDMAQAADREIRWLKGDLGDPQPGTAPFGHQCWGEVLADSRGLEPVSWQQRFSALPMGFRERCWYWCGRQINGSSWSLYGGQWCAGV